MIHTGSVNIFLLGLYVGAINIQPTMYTGTPKFFNLTATVAWQTFPAYAATHLEVFNNTGQSIVLDHGAGTSTFTIPTGNSKVTHSNATLSEIRYSCATGPVNFDVEAWG